MKKLASLRQFLADKIPDLKRDPDSLLIFANKGKLVSTLGPSLSFEYRYQGEVILTDYNGHADTLMVPLLIWIRANQPDLLMRTADEQSGINFEAELLNHETADISITLDLSERVVVRMVGGKSEITHVDEPPLDDLTGPTGWDMYAGGTPVAEL